MGDGAGLSPVSLACIEMFGRIGAPEVQIRFSEEKPVAWTAVAVFSPKLFEAAAAASPDRAILRLAEQLVDGGRCAHCGQMTMLVADPFAPSAPALIDGARPCEYRFDPELVTFRRRCQDQFVQTALLESGGR